MIAAEERALMEETMRGALADAVANGDDVDAVLSRLDWLDLLRDEPGDAIGIVFDALGRTNATASALDDVLSVALGLEPRSDLAILLPSFGGWGAPGAGSGELHAEGLATARAAHARELLVVCCTASLLQTVAVPAEAAEVRRIRGVDPDGGLHGVRVRAGAEGAAPLDPSTWSSAVALAQRAVAHQIAGACRTMLDLARSHALEREQFGRPIARFQAVRHRLAETLVAVEGLEAALGAAREDPGPETAALAKAVAGRTQRTVGRHTQQVLAGIGFTTEHAFHRTLKRSMTLEGIFGSADAICLDLGRRLLAERRVATLIEL
jgi:hypothetical protein